MSLIKSLFKTKNLWRNGLFITVSGISLLILGYFIPDYKSGNIKQQIFTLNGFNTKHNDKTEVSDFYQSIKKNDGFLVMGTSETGKIDGGNYYDFLNNDKELVSNKFSILAGAGRTCGIHIPLLLHHKEELDSLKIIYFINPVYWRKDLCDVSLEYWNRYNNYKMSNNFNLSLNDKDRFLKPVIAYNKKLNWFKKAVLYLEQSLRSARRNYFHKLRYNLYPEEYSSQFSFIPTTKIDYSKDPIYRKSNIENIDSVWNISKSFTHKEWFKPINKTSKYRYEELTSFLNLCQKIGIQATFIVGPYNERFIKEYDLNSLPDYKEVTENIKQLLTNNNADFIDATDISPVVGAFNDHQHHSSFGAYLIYLKIKHHLYEKENS
jgi:hypothetical protein